MMQKNSSNATPNDTRIDNGREECIIQPILWFYITCFGIIIVLVVVGNLVVLFNTNPIWNKPRRSNIELLIFYLAIFDLLGSVFLVTDIYDNLTCFQKWIFSWFGCKVIYPSYDILLNMSVCILTIMSVDRCRSIMTPLKRKFSHTRIHLAVFISFIVSVAQQWFQFSLWTLDKGKECSIDRDQLQFSLPRLINIALRDAIFIFVFTATSILVYKALKYTHLIDMHHDRKKQEIRTVIWMLITMETVFGFLVIPYDVFHCTMLISRIMPGDHAIEFTDTMNYVDKALSILQMSNGFANCFIYAKVHRSITGSPSTKMRRSTNQTTTEYIREKSSKRGKDGTNDMISETPM